MTEYPCDVHAKQLEQLEESNKDQWTHINKLYDRINEIMRKWIPVWVALILSLSTGITGAAIALVVAMFKFAKFGS